MSITPKRSWRQFIGNLTVTLFLFATGSNLYSDVGSALEQEGLTWTTGGADYDLQDVASPEFVDGDALLFVRTGTENQAWIETQIDGPFEVRFSWRIRNVLGSASIGFSIDGVNENLYSQTTNWNRHSIQVVSDGEHTIRWLLHDSAEHAGSENAVWLDSLTISRSPIISAHPRPTALKIGDSTTLSAQATEFLPNSYQWKKDSLNLEGQTNPNLELSNVTRSDAGTYSVEISNANGASLSREAILIVYENLGDSVEQSDWTWTVGGTKNWYPQSEETYDGEDALAYLPSGFNGLSSIETTIEGPGEVSFHWKYTSQYSRSYDFFFFIDGAIVEFAQNGQRWGRVKHTITVPGTHTLKWEFNNPIPRNETESPRAWIDQIRFEQKPIIISHPIERIVMDGETITFAVSVESATPVSYQWRKDGVDIAAATSNILSIEPASNTDNGLYDVVVANSGFEVISNSAEAFVTQSIDSALNQSALQWDTDGEPFWTPQVENTHDGELALEANTRRARLKTTIEGPLSLSFWWKSENNPSNGALTFEIDGTTKSSTVNKFGWVQETFQIPEPGPHELLWTFSPDEYEGNRAWIDELEFDYSPIITQNLYDQSAKIGTDLILEAHVASSSALSYQWMKDGSELPGETQSTLTLPRVSESDIANYSVRVSNEHGSVLSNTETIYLYDNFGDSIEQPNLEWTFGDRSNWFVQSDETLDGIDAANVRSNGESEFFTDWMETSIEGPFEISFWWRNQDQCCLNSSIKIDGVTRAMLSSESQGWIREDIVVHSPGPQVIRFEINSSNPLVSGLLIDRISISYPPFITTQPTDQSIPTSGLPITLSVAATSAAPMSFQWFKDGIEISGAISSSLALANTSPQDSGFYFVRISNPDGTIDSKSSRVRVSNPYGNALGQPTLEWTGSDDFIWYAQNRISIDGGDALEAQVLGWDASAWFETTIEGPATVSFLWRLKGDSSQLSISVDNEIAAWLYEPTLWQSQSVEIRESGSHTLRWKLAGNDQEETQSAWVDAIQVSHLPIIAKQPQSLLIGVSESGELSVEAISGSPISYQWIKDGIELLGANVSSLNLTGAPSNLGLYEVVLTNASGSLSSRKITVDSLDIINRALDSSGLVWATNNSGKIELQSFQTTDQIDALSLETKDSLTLETTFEGPAIIEFDWRMENAFHGGILGVVDDQGLSLDPFGFEWKHLRYSVPQAGSHTLKWTLYRYESSDVDVRLFIDQLKILRSPLITRNPGAAVLSAGQPHTLSVATQSDSSIAYQWRKDGTIIVGASASSYVIGNPNSSDGGVYDVVLTNAQGETTSDSAELIFEDALKDALDTAFDDFALGGSGTVSIDQTVSHDGEDSMRFDVEPGEVLWLEALSNRPSKISFWWRNSNSACNGSAIIRSNQNYIGYIDQGTNSDWQYFEWNASIEDSNSFLWIFEPGWECSGSFHLDQVKIEYDPIQYQPNEFAGTLGRALDIPIDWQDTYEGSFQWRKNGSPIPGQTGPQLHIDSFQHSDTGIYDIAYALDGETFYSAPISVVAIENIGEPIEAEDRDWLVGDSGQWLFNSVDAWDGKNALVMKSANENDLPWIETTVEGPATVTFKWWIGWSNCDQIHFYVNDENVRSYKGRNTFSDWREEEVVIEKGGLHTLKWGILDKDCEYLSTAMLDNVSISRAPIIIRHPRSKNMIRGNTIAVEVMTRSDNDTYQWRKDGSNIPGANSPTLLVSSPGKYDVATANAYGVSISNTATIEEQDPIGHLVEQPDLHWETRSGEPWFANHTLSTEGGDSLSSPELPMGGSSSATTYILGPTSLSFDYRIWGSTNKLRARFNITGILYPVLENDMNFDGDDWTQYSVTIEEPGLHRVYWSARVDEIRPRRGVVTPYVKSPKLIIDNLKISNKPIFKTHPLSINTLAGESIHLSGEAITPEIYGPIQYEWYKDGVPIAGAKSDTLFIQNPSMADRGTYTLLATNSLGSASSRASEVDVLTRIGDALGSKGIALSTETTSPWKPIGAESTSLAFRASLDPEHTNVFESQMAAVVEGPATLSFRWRKSVVYSGTNLSFEIDGSEIANRSLGSGWGKETVYIPEGQHYLRWILKTNYESVLGWVSDIEFNQNYPFIDLKTHSTKALHGTTIVIEPEIISDSPVDYQWLFDDSPILGATQSILRIENIDSSHAGRYRLQATNESGASISKAWILTVLETPNFVVGQTDLEFEFDGPGSWSMNRTSRGNERIRSPLLEPRESSSFSTRINGPARIQFDFSAFFESIGNRFEFLVDGKVLASYDQRTYAGTFRHNILQRGEHTLTWRITMNDFEVDESHFLYLENLTITTDLLSVYEEWLQLLFSANSSQADKDLQADPDGDTKSNILEFLLGSDPLVADGPISIEIVEIDGQTYWQSILDLIAWVNGIEFQFETSSDLKNWEPLETEFDLQDTGERALLQLRSEAPDTLDTTQFVRVKLSYQINEF